MIKIRNIMLPILSTLLWAKIRKWLTVLIFQNSFKENEEFKEEIYYVCIFSIKL